MQKNQKKCCKNLHISNICCTFAVAKVIIKKQRCKFLVKNMTKFSEFFENVRNKDVEAIRFEVENLVSSQTFRNWAKGIYEPDAKFWGQLNEIATRRGYNPIYTL